MIAGLLAAYGVILVLLGVFNASDEELARGDGLNINLWGGAGMLSSGRRVRGVGPVATGCRSGGDRRGTRPVIFRQ
ncbi:hypothetical protein [Aeromicrobium sp. UC242_57]|uniref:hypothetical protein n=1 Tax=Aeromicrobium sp. UC242_57 TaxID=3374624 RepID=UPI00379F2BF2